MNSGEVAQTQQRENDQEAADQLESLLARIALKDQKALQQLYQKVAGKLNGIAMKILQDADLSNDVLQETFLQIWHRAGEYRRDLGEPMAWMSSLLRYRTLDQLRVETREQKRRNQFEEVQSLFGETHAVSPIHLMLQQDVNSGLNRCLETLDITNRNAILMAYYYGYSREDIAIHVEQPINTVKSWLKRGLTRLAKCLGH
jgi:RNA polymerase sigma-70 factor (ECF subfamily)